jgi:hypothetical protein
MQPPGGCARPFDRTVGGFPKKGWYQETARKIIRSLENACMTETGKRRQISNSARDISLAMEPGIQGACGCRPRTPAAQGFRRRRFVSSESGDETWYAKIDGK